MNKGTKLRTVLRVAASLQNTAVILTASVNAFAGEYHIGWLVFAWALFAIICDFVVSALTTYYNNDYTEEACEATGEMRARKAEKNGINGEYFYMDLDDDPLQEEEGEDESEDL